MDRKPLLGDDKKPRYIIPDGDGISSTETLVTANPGGITKLSDEIC
jgi:hypothetical protein